MINLGRPIRCILVTLVCATGAFVRIASAAPPTERIIDGTKVPATDHPAVTKINLPDSLCTGTLIAPRFVLSAAHCFFDERNNPLTDVSGVQAVVNNVPINAKAVTIHPTYVPRSSACVQGEIDAAVLELSEDASGVAPIELSRTAPVQGTQLLLVGFGTQGRGASGEDGTVPEDGFVNFGITSIERIPDDVYVEWTFNRGESNTASGDSGGPAFADVNGIRYLNSITCGGTGNAEIGSDSSNTRVDTMASWIDSITGSSPSGQAPAFLGLGSITTGANRAFSYRVQVTGSAPIEVSASGLPEGLSISGNTITGTPITAGTFTVSLTASNGVGSTNGSFVLNVTEFDPASALALKRVKVNFEDEEEDLLTLSGNFTIDTPLTAAGTVVRVQIGDLVDTFTLNRRGSARRARGFDTVRLTGARTGSSFTGPTVRFAIGLGDRVDLFDKLDALFPVNVNRLASSFRVFLPVELEINGITYRSTIAMRYVRRTGFWVNG